MAGKEMKPMFVYPDRYSLEYLEELNLTYDEMVKYFSCKVRKDVLSRKFRKYGIHHKTKRERIKIYLKAFPNASIRKIAMKTQSSDYWVCKVKKEMRNENL